MATLNELNRLLNLPPDASPSDRRSALRALTLAGLAQLCLSFPNPQDTYAQIRSSIQPLEWDVECDAVDVFPTWGNGERLATIHIGRKGRDAAVEIAWETLNEFFNICYPPSLSDIPAVWSFEKDEGTVVGRFDNQLITRGVDKYSTAVGLKEYNQYLAAEQLVGVVSPLEDATLFEVAA